MCIKLVPVNYSTSTLKEMADWVSAGIIQLFLAVNICHAKDLKVLWLQVWFSSSLHVLFFIYLLNYAHDTNITMQEIELNQFY